MRISLRRGIPSVMFMSPLPEKWNVLSVICVEGSPTDCAASTPTGSPGSTIARMFFTYIFNRSMSLKHL